MSENSSWECGALSLFTWSSSVSSSAWLQRKITWFDQQLQNNCWMDLVGNVFCRLQNVKKWNKILGYRRPAEEIGVFAELLITVLCRLNWKTQEEIYDIHKLANHANHAAITWVSRLAEFSQLKCILPLKVKGRHNKYYIIIYSEIHAHF